MTRLLVAQQYLYYVTRVCDPAQFLSIVLVVKLSSTVYFEVAISSHLLFAQNTTCLQPAKIKISYLFEFSIRAVIKASGKLIRHQKRIDNTILLFFRLANEVMIGIDWLLCLHICPIIGN